MTEIRAHTCFPDAVSLAGSLDDDVDGLLEDEIRHCPDCSPLLEQLERWAEELENPDWLVATEAATAPDLAAELLGLPHEHQLCQAEHRERYHQWGLAQLYLTEAQRYRSRDPRTSFERAEVAVRIVEGVSGGGDPLYYDLRWLADLRAKAWAFLADGWRQRRDFPRAEEAFLRADAFVTEGTRGGRALACVLALRASLLADQRRVMEASVLLERVAQIHRGAEDLPALGETLLRLSSLEAHLEELPGAARRAREALPLLATEAQRLDARLHLGACLLEAGELEEAAAELARIPAGTGPAVTGRRDWLAARLAHQRDEPRRARELFAAARTRLADEGLGHELALASLDLAILEHDSGRTERVRELLDEALPLLILEGAPHEVFAALRVVYEAMGRDNLSLELLRNAVRRLKRVGKG